MSLVFWNRNGKRDAYSYPNIPTQRHRQLDNNKPTWVQYFLFAEYSDYLSYGFHPQYITGSVPQ